MDPNRYRDRALAVDESVRIAHNRRLRQGSCIERRGMMISCGLVRAAMRMSQLAAKTAVLTCRNRSMFAKQIRETWNESMACLLLNVGDNE